MNWKLVLAILTCNILFMSSSYTMLIPFLPMYLTMELGVSDADVNLWSGIVFSATFLVSAVMAPIWGRMADTKGKRLMAMRASFLLAISTSSAASSRRRASSRSCACSRALPPASGRWTSPS